MNKTVDIIPKTTVIHDKTGTVHYARYSIRQPEPICYVRIEDNRHYSFTDKQVTCKVCQQPYYKSRANVVEGWWSEQIEKALKVKKTCKCPFELFANKHGYDLKYDRLLFPDSAPEFIRRRCDYHGLPHRGWMIRHSIDVGGLPKNVEIGSVGSRTTMYYDRVALIKFMEYGVDGLFIPWELIKAENPEKRHLELPPQILLQI